MISEFTSHVLILGHFPCPGSLHLPQFLWSVTLTQSGGLHS